MSLTIHYLIYIVLFLTALPEKISENGGFSVFELNRAFIPYSQTIPGSEVSIEMIPISGGEFEMGPFENNASQKVSVDPFWIGKYEITWSQYDLFTKETIQTLDLSTSILTTDSPKEADAISIPTPPYVDMSFGMGRDGYPAISMTHYAAVMFTKWLYVKTGFFFRLPTEAEWEFTCKTNHQNFSSLINSNDLNRFAWYKTNSDRKYHQVGSKEPSDMGVYDLLGNVSEWTLDQYQADYSEIFSTEGTKNPFIKPTSLYPRTVRGGSWMDDANDLACTRRIASNKRWQRQDPQLPKSLWWLTDAPFLGFRIVRPKKAPTEQEMQQYWIEAMEAY